MHAVLHARLVAKPVGGRIQQGATAQVIDHRQTMLATQRDEICQTDLGCETDLAKVGAVNAQQRGGCRADGIDVVGQMSAVGRAHLHQAGAAGLQHVGDAKAAADLHQLSARNDHLAIARQRHQAKQHGRCVVVDHQRILRPGEAAQQVNCMDIARAALPSLQLIFEVAVSGAG